MDEGADNLNDATPAHRGPIRLTYLPTLPPRKWARMTRVFILLAAVGSLILTNILLFNPIILVHLQGNDDFLGGGIVGTPFAPVHPGTDDRFLHEYTIEALCYFVVFLLAQWFFLTPRGNWRVSASLDQPLPKRSAVAAGFIGMLLSFGLIATLMEIPNWWLAWTCTPSANPDPTQSVQHFGGMWIVMAALWTVWACIFWWYGRSLDRYTAMRRIFRWLIAGTVLELLIAAPAHAIIVESRSGDCYCERGTWTGVAFGCTAVLWLFGPGAILLLLREKRRRELLI